MPEEPKKEDPAPKKSKRALLIPALGGVVVLTLALGGWFWHRSKATQAAEPEKSEALAVLHLESFVVNLSGKTENGYLRVGIDLGIEAELKEGEKQAPFMGRLRDAILSVLGTRTVDELLTAEGKTKLKDDLLKAINDRVPEVRCREVYFTEFLVQH
jgi:flagellar FliL protein